MSSENPLGKNSSYPQQYSPELLHAIERAVPEESERFGYDLWTLYELGWRDQFGSLKVAMAELTIPADSPFIVESKSLKIYINSFFYTQFESIDKLVQCVESDLNELLNSRVSFQVKPVDQAYVQQYNQASSSATVVSLDDCIVDLTTPKPAELLTQGDTKIEQQKFVTDRFRSMCPVTGQPDWASVFIKVKGRNVAPQALAQFLLSFAEHADFHEVCVEKIYAHLTKQLSPEALCVCARYTRRGGIDINPIRASSPSYMDMLPRRTRQ